MLWWLLVWFPYFFSDCPWPCCGLHLILDPLDLIPGKENLSEIIITQEFCLIFQVSWLKRHGDTPHLLTFGLTTYSSDSRFQIFHEQPNDWKLQIQFPQLSDQGIYECLVSTNPPLVRRTRLAVIGE